MSNKSTPLRDKIKTIFHYEGRLIATLFSIAFLVIGCLLYDLSELTHHDKNGIVIDKYRAVGANVNYVTEVTVIDLHDRIVEKGCSEIFYRFKVGDKVSYSFDSGRLGSEHNIKINLVH